MRAMPRLVHVTTVEVVGDHRLRLTFEDGAEARLTSLDGSGAESSSLWRIRPTSAASSLTRSWGRSSGPTAPTSHPRLFTVGSAAI